MSLLKTNFELVKTLEAFYTGGNVQLTSTGDCFLCTCGDTVNIIDTSTGVKLSELKDDGDEVSCLAVSPDNKIVVTASSSLLMHQFDMDEKKLTCKWKAAHKTAILAMTFDKTSTLLATGSADTTVKVYDTEKRYYTHSFKDSDGSVSLVKFHPIPEKLFLFSSSSSAKIRMWDLKTNKCSSIFDGHFSQVTGIEFSQDASIMVSAGRDKVVIIWDLPNRKQMRTVPVYECIEGLIMIPKHVKVLTLPTNEYFVTAGETGCLRVWSLVDGRCIYSDPQYKKRHENIGISNGSSFLQLCYNETLNCVIGVTYDHNILFFGLSNMNLQKQFIGYYDEIVDIKLFGTEEQYIAVATNSEEVKVVHRETHTSEILQGHTGTVLSIDVSYDGKYIASCSKDNSIRVWCLDEDSKLFCCVAVGNGHTHGVYSISWPKSSTDYLISGSHDFTLKCWKLPCMLIKSETTNLTVKWTEKAHDKNINVVNISPNDKLIVSGSQDKTAKVWKLKTGSLVGTLRGHKRGIWCALFSPVDQCIATSSADSTIKLWALSNFTCVKTFEGHTNSVLKVQFVQNGMQLLSSGSEGLIKLWNVRNDECVATLEGHEDKVWAMCVTKEEDIVVTGGADSLIKFWKDVTEETRREDEEKKENQIHREQELSNLLHDKQFDKAVNLAISLDQPYRVLKIIKDVLLNDDGQTHIENIVENLNVDQLDSLLMFMCDWNTNAKHSYASQTVLSTILKLKHPDEIMEFPNIKHIVEVLLPYTERHYERMNQLVQQSMFVDYTWESMQLS